MAAKVISLSETEYDKFKADISKYEADYISEINRSVKKIESLNSTNGGLYAENVSANIMSLISSINKIKQTTISMHTVQNSAVASFCQAMDDYDTCC